MRFLALTFDASGNLPPLLGLIEALTVQGHQVLAMGHDTQQRQIEAAGADFLPFKNASQRDAASPVEPMVEWLAGFAPAAHDEFLAVAQARAPDILIVDALLSQALAGANASAWPSIALVHAPYQVLIELLDGRFRAPIEGADLVLVTSYAAFHDGPPVPANVVFSGPSRPAVATPWSPREPGRRLILASLSTGQQNQAPALRRLCEALCGVDAEVLVTTGLAIAPDELPSAAHMTLVRAAPHEAVLAHADLLVTHGGHGTLMAGLAAGVPILALPGIAGDQPPNAARVAGLGLGEVLDAASRPEAIRETISRLLGDRDLRRRCQSFAASVRAAPGMEAAVARIEAMP